MNTAVDEIRKRLVTVADFQRLGELGFFAHDERVELIEGEIFDMPPIGEEHIGIVDLLTYRFVTAVGKQAIVRVQSSIRLGDLSAPQPDICLLRKQEDFYRQTPQLPEDVLLVVEVSDSSLRYDREVKLPLYAHHAVPEVWIVNVQHRELMRFTEPVAASYRSESRLDVASGITPARLPDLSVDLSELFIINH